MAKYTSRERFSSSLQGSSAVEYRVMKHTQSLIVACIALASAWDASAAQSCESLKKVSLAEHRLIIREAKEIKASAPGISPALPNYCHVAGVLDERTGRDGKPYGIGFAVALPEKWNGRFLFQGGGGLNGSV